MAPLEPWQKVLVDVESYPETAHGEIACVDCHGGLQDSAKDIAHTDLISRPSNQAGATCGQCHEKQSDLQQGSLHSNQQGYWTVLEARGASHDDPAMQEMFGNHCASCHTTCGDCHVSQPAIVGGGGKTSLMFGLARELGAGCLTATTTRIFAAQMKHAPAAVHADDLLGLEMAVRRFGTALVVGDVAADKVLGIPPDLPAELLKTPGVRHVVVEADGSRMRPCKAPAEHEPVIPLGTSLLIPLAGIDCLDRPLSEVAHRPERVAALTGLATSDIVTEQALATLLIHPQGGLKQAPPGARIIPFLNKVETPIQHQRGRRVAHHMLQQV